MECVQSMQISKNKVVDHSDAVLILRIMYGMECETCEGFFLDDIHHTSVSNSVYMQIAQTR